ncbi:hypothetical protein CUMW_244070, partial [Citrus unshiu]
VHVKQAEQDCGKEKVLSSDSRKYDCIIGKFGVLMPAHAIAKKVLMSEAAVLFISLNPNLSLWITQDKDTEQANVITRKPSDIVSNYQTPVRYKASLFKSFHSYLQEDKWMALNGLCLRILV